MVAWLISGQNLHRESLQCVLIAAISLPYCHLLLALLGICNGVCEFQTLPALILKIMRGSVIPVADHYSAGLRQLILDMLHLDPGKRPTINQIMAQPFILGTLLSLYTDFGRIPCNRSLCVFCF